MHERLLIAGSGGQGILFIGRLMAAAAMRNVPHVTFFPAYGAEVRGGTSNCQVILSSREIASPVAERFDSMMLMNQASLERFIDRQAEDALVLVNRSLCTVPESRRGITGVRATELAKDLGNARVANLVILGAYLARRPLVAGKDLEAGLVEILAGKDAALTDLNIRAFRAGMKE
jgi:2-oxoglutarate ferredoxin oxidoreductase subunit gamma